jgi:general secretion pathway protein C
MKLGATLPERLRRLTSRPAAPGGRGAGPALAALGPQLLTVLAAAAIAAQLAILIWKFVPGAHRPPAPPAPRPPPSADVGALLRARLFGAPSSAGPSGADAPRTRVALVLAGTLAVRDPTQGLAIIGETAQNARLHVVGAQLPGGVRLHEVYPDRVVIDRDGVLETLPLPRQVTGGTAGTLVAPLSAAGNAMEPPLAESVQRLIAQGPEVIGEVLRPMPTYANGQLKGFRVYAGRDRRKFAKLGLQAGDLVTQINGVPLGDAQHGMEILRSLGSAGAANVTIERGGGTQQLSIDASQIASLTAPAGEAPPPPANDTAPPNPD